MNDLIKKARDWSHDGQSDCDCCLDDPEDWDIDCPVGLLHEMADVVEHICGERNAAEAERDQLRARVVAMRQIASYGYASGMDRAKALDNILTLLSDPEAVKETT